MTLSKDKKIDLLRITLSAASIILSFILSIDYISWFAIIFCGIPIFKECIERLTKEFDIKADLLVSIAIISSVLIGEVVAAGEIATIMAIGGFLEEYTVSKTQNKIKSLIKMTPQKAIRITNGKEEEIPVKNIKIGDILKILPGENIPTDGIIVSGKTSIDQSTLTGESEPADKQENDEVYSGTVNLYGSFTMKVTKSDENSSLKKLIRLVESSKPENSKIVRQVDKWATLIVVIAFISALLTYLFTFDIIRCVTILVVFCPCAMVLATPTAVMATIGNLTRHGILVKDGASIEELAHTSEVVFDKTGTLTHGTLEVVNVVSDNPKEMMYLLASLESKSEHPIAKGIMKFSNNDKLAEVDNFKTHIGNGVSGEIEGSLVCAGSETFFKNLPLKKNSPINGETVIYVSKDNKFLGEVHLGDTLRENAARTVNELKKLRIKTSILTGDNEKTARFVANRTKIRNVKSNCMPEDKVEYIKNEQILGHRVTMVGDGVNDAPSLRKANVGITMAEIGSDISIESANITLINEDLSNISRLIKIARNTVKIINICIGFSLILNFIAMILAIFGTLNPIEGALIHNIGSVAVIIYASSLSRMKLSKNFQSKKLGATKTLNKQMT